jgi:hypothetical protein
VQHDPVQHDWENPGMISYNKQDAHASLVPCLDIESALHFATRDKNQPQKKKKKIIEARS